MLNARVYEEMLASIGTIQQLSEKVSPEENSLENYTDHTVTKATCCNSTQNIVIRSGTYCCYSCGAVTDNYVYEWYQPQHKGNGPLGCMNTMTITRKRFYSSLTHFKEHLRRYMGARFTVYGDEVVRMLRLQNIDVEDKDCYLNVQKALRKNGMRKLYKEIFTLIYALGGKNPKIDNKLFDDCVTDFKWLYEGFQQMKKSSNTRRKNMPSMYIILDLLLKRNGHTPYYNIPYLKDKDLQARVIMIYNTLSHDIV